MPTDLSVFPSPTHMYIIKRYANGSATVYPSALWQNILYDKTVETEHKIAWILSLEVTSTIFHSKFGSCTWTSKVRNKLSLYCKVRKRRSLNVERVEDGKVSYKAVRKEWLVLVSTLFENRLRASNHFEESNAQVCLHWFHWSVPAAVKMLR